jgi:hypothetical protein
MPEQRAAARRPPVEDPDREREDWIQLLGGLVREVKAWVQPDWSTREVEKAMQDSILGAYSAPALLMQRTFTRVLLEPITRFAPGTDGVVDLYLMPAYDDIASLYRAAGEWKLQYEFRGEGSEAGARRTEPLALTRENFLRALDSIAGHAA